MYTISNKGSVKQNFLQFTGFSHLASAAQKMPNLKKLVGKTLAIKAVNFVGFYTAKFCCLQQIYPLPFLDQPSKNQGRPDLAVAAISELVLAAF